MSQFDSRSCQYELCFIAKAAHVPAPAPAPTPAPTPARGHAFWLLPVSARVFTLVAKNRARGFCSARAGSSSPSSQVDKSTGMEQCSISVQHASRKVRPRAHNVAPGWPLRRLLGSLVQNTSLHRPVFRFPLPVFPGVKRGPFEQATGQGLFSCGVPGGEACHDTQPVNSSCLSSN